MLFFAALTYAQNTAGITGVRDTSFNTASEYRKLKPKYPQLDTVARARLRGVRERFDISFCTIGNRALQLDAFFPKKKRQRNGAAIVLLHGGGWRSGDRTQQHEMARRLAARGYVCFTPEYRLSTEALYPAAVHDGKAALRWVHEHAGSYGVDTSKIAVLGFSSGGELAAFLATTQQHRSYEGAGCSQQSSSTVHALIDIDGTLSFVHPESGEGDDSKRKSAATLWFGYGKQENLPLWKDASPLAHVDARTPPTLFINSGVARMHAGRSDFLQVLRTHNIFSEVQEFRDAPHAFPLFHPWFEPTIGHVDAFLKKVFFNDARNAR
ncbi:MAG: alpha/beta hydrolase [Chitinophagaceae bacterium]|nr:MAG: alpha/beta hydrolase [Chitinophagaceae bacterium]